MLALGLAVAAVPARPTLLAGQTCADADTSCARPSTNIGGKEVAAFAAGVVAIMTVDEIIDRAVRDGRSTAGDVGLEPFRAYGNGAAMAVVSGGTLLMGLATGDSTLILTGARLTATFVLASGLVHTTKFLLGRARPSAEEGAWSYHPFTAGSSFYSGHSTMAFSLATALSMEMDNPYATVVLYATATLAGLSRVYDTNHWMSDVVAGAVMGIASAKFVYGRWTIFGLRAPAVLAGPDGARISYQFSF